MKISELHTKLKFKSRSEFYNYDKRHLEEITVPSLSNANCSTGIVCKDDAINYSKLFIEKFGNIEFTKGFSENSFKPLTTPKEMELANTLNANSIGTFLKK